MNIDIPKDIKLKCWNYLQNNNMGNRHSANGNKEEQLVGLLGEVLTKQLFNIEHKFLNGFDGGYDFIYKENKIDVKTMGRTVNVKDYFVHNFIAFQENYNCDVYIFNSLNKKNNKLNICGWIKKKDLLQNSIFYKKGSIRQRSNGTSFKMKTNTYEIKNNQLNNIKELL